LTVCRARAPGIPTTNRFLRARRARHLLRVPKVQIHKTCRKMEKRKAESKWKKAVMDLSTA
jgi:hypothetical protein